MLIALLVALFLVGALLSVQELGVMVALDPPVVNYVPLEEATRRMKLVPLDGDTIRTGRDLGICFGD